MYTVKFKGVYRYTYNWLFIDADPEITKYYRKLYEMSTYGCDKLQRPENASHITIISKHQEKPPEFHLREYDGDEVEFELDLDAKGCDTYVWMTVDCPHAQQIRDKLGLGLPYYPFHLTIGNRKYHDNIG